MRRGAKLASAQFTLLPPFGAARGTTHGQSRVFFGAHIHIMRRCLSADWSIVTTPGVSISSNTLGQSLGLEPDSSHGRSCSRTAILNLRIVSYLAQTLSAAPVILNSPECVDGAADADSQLSSLRLLRAGSRSHRRSDHIQPIGILIRVSAPNLRRARFDPKSFDI
jgi:hypothetical protein